MWHVRRSSGGPGGDDALLGPGAVKLDDKFKFMALAAASPKAGTPAGKGAADDAWDD